VPVNGDVKDSFVSVELKTNLSSTKMAANSSSSVDHDSHVGQAPDLGHAQDQWMIIHANQSNTSQSTDEIHNTLFQPIPDGYQGEYTTQSNPAKTATG
jgi:hypothetical protein